MSESAPVAKPCRGCGPRDPAYPLGDMSQFAPDLCGTCQSAFDARVTPAPTSRRGDLVNSILEHFEDPHMPEEYCADTCWHREGKALAAYVRSLELELEIPELPR